MGYKKDVNQNGIPTGKARYNFYVRINGKRYRTTVICKPSLARNYYKRWEDKIENELDGSFTFYEKLDEFLLYCKDFKSDKMFITTARSIKRFKKCFRDMELNDFQRYHIEDFIIWRKKRNFCIGSEVKNSTINRDISNLSSFFNYCIVRNYYRRNNPAYRAKLKENNQREISLSNEQINEMLSLAEGKLYTAVFTCYVLRFKAGRDYGPQVVRYRF